MTTLLTTKEVGFYFLLMSFASYFGLVIMNPIGVYLTRKLHIWEHSAQLTKAFIIFNTFVLLASLIAYPFALISSYFIDFQSHSWLAIGTLLFSFLFSSTWNNTIIPSLNMLNYKIAFVVLTFFTQLFALIFSYIAVSHYGASAFYWIAGQVISFFIWFIIAAFFYFIQHNQKILLIESHREVNKDRIKTLWSFSAPIAITNVSLWLLNQSYRPILEKFVGLEYLGFFGLGFGMASSLSVAFEYLLQQFYYPKYYKDLVGANKAERESAWNSLANRIIPLYIFLCLFIGLLSPYFIRILAAEKFWDAYIFISIGIIVEFFRMTNNILSLATHSEMKTKDTVVPYFAGGIITFLTVLYGSQSEYFKIATPTFIVLGNILVFFLIRVKVRKLFIIDFNYTNIFIPIALASPLLIGTYLRNVNDSIYFSVGALSLSGLYFLAIQVFLFNRGEKHYG